MKLENFKIGDYIKCKCGNLNCHLSGEIVEFYNYIDDVRVLREDGVTLSLSLDTVILDNEFNNKKSIKKLLGIK